MGEAPQGEDQGDGKLPEGLEEDLNTVPKAMTYPQPWEIRRNRNQHKATIVLREAVQIQDLKKVFIRSSIYCSF